MSFRAIARSAPRAATRLTTTTVRRSTPFASALRAPASASFRPLAASFSTSVSRRSQSDSEVDTQLSSKLEQEIQFEAGVDKGEQVPASVKDFLDSGLFEIEDVAGKEEVILRRQHGNET